jgi:hypothetical protein
MALWYAVIATIGFVILRSLWARHLLRSRFDEFAQNDHQELSLDDAPRSLRKMHAAYKPELERFNFKPLIFYRSTKFLKGRNFYCIYLSPERDTLFELLYFASPLSQRLLMLACFSSQALNRQDLVRHCETHFEDDTIVTVSDMAHISMPSWVRALSVSRSASISEILAAHTIELTRHEATHPSERIKIVDKEHFLELEKKTRARLAKLNEAHYENLLKDGTLGDPDGRN